MNEIFVEEKQYVNFLEFYSDLLSLNKYKIKKIFFIFRGTSDDKYQLIPTLYREENKLKFYSDIEDYTNSDYIYEECSSVYNFYRIANNNGLITPSISNFNTIDDLDLFKNVLGYSKKKKYLMNY